MLFLVIKTFCFVLRRASVEICTSEKVGDGDDVLEWRSFGICFKDWYTFLHSDVMDTIATALSESISSSGVSTVKSSASTQSAFAIWSLSNFDKNQHPEIISPNWFAKDTWFVLQSTYWYLCWFISVFKFGITAVIIRRVEESLWIYLLVLISQLVGCP